MRTISVRPATERDIRALGFSRPSVRVRAWTGLIDDEPVALGGYWYAPDGSTVAFLNAETEICQSAPVALMKAAKAVIVDARERGFCSLRAICNPDIAAAARFLDRIGFHPIDPKRGEYLLDLSDGVGNGGEE